MMAAPTMAYQPLELKKGMGSKGGVTEDTKKAIREALGIT